MSLSSHQYVVLPPALGTRSKVKIIWDDGSLFAVCCDCEVNVRRVSLRWECPVCNKWMADARGYVWIETYNLSTHAEDYILKQWLAFWTGHRIADLNVKVHS